MFCWIFPHQSLFGLVTLVCPGKEPPPEEGTGAKGHPAQPPIRLGASSNFALFTRESEASRVTFPLLALRRQSRRAFDSGDFVYSRFQTLERRGRLRTALSSILKWWMLCGPAPPASEKQQPVRNLPAGISGLEQLLLGELAPDSQKKIDRPFSVQ